MQVQYSILSSPPVPFPLGIHALLVGSLDRACSQAEPTSPFEMKEAQHTHTHTRPINGSSTTLTNLPHPGIYALGQLARQASALTRERGTRFSV